MENKTIEMLHRDSEGYFCIATNTKYWQQYYFNNCDDVAINLEKHDVYISQNTFNNRSRKLIHLKELKALYIDIDCYNKNLTKEAVKYFLENDLYGEIPIPNCLVDSGRGLYYIILLENTSVEDLPKWQLIERYLFDKLEHLGADSKCIDATRVLRVVGSTNSKNGQTVNMIEEYGYRYTLDEIIDNYIPDVWVDEKEKKKKQNNSSTKPPRVRKKVSHQRNYSAIYNLYSLYYSRIQDFYTLVKLRNYEMTGLREITLFLYRHFSNVYYTNDVEALEATLDFNNKFTEPLSEDEVILATASASIEATEKVYKYSNDKLIEVLQITSLEQEYLTTIISKNEKYKRNNKRRYQKRRNSAGLTKKEIDKIKLKNDIKDLLEMKYTKDDIEKKLNISNSTLKRYIKKIKEEAE
ncbi:MAG: DNA-binding response regulator [Sarcina sp.]